MFLLYSVQYHLLGRIQNTAHNYYLYGRGQLILLIVIMSLPLLTVVFKKSYAFLVNNVIECLSGTSIIICLLFFEEAGQDRVTVTSTISENQKVEGTCYKMHILFPL
jgi:hypothetical protein